MSSTSLLSTTPSESRPVDWGRFFLVGVGTVITAVLANVLVYFTGSFVVGYDPEFVVLRNISAVILFTVVPAGATGGQTAVLAVMHVVAAAVIVWMLTTLTQPQSRSRDF